MSSAINLDAIEEVKVLLNTFKAEFGRSGGANIQIVTKSGGAGYRGSAYYYARRDAWNATRWENNRSTSPSRNTTSIRTAPTWADPRPSRALVAEDKKLFFFYSLEAPQGQRPPGPIRRYRLPTELERRGDFSQTSTSRAGRSSSATRCARNVQHPVRRPGCFPGNIVPADRIDPQRPGAPRHLPAAEPHRPRIDGDNYLRQETADHPRSTMSCAPTGRTPANTSFFSTLRTFSSKQTGSEITAGPPDWGFYDGTYEFSDNSISGGLDRGSWRECVNDLSGGVGRRTEGFGVGAESDWRPPAQGRTSATP